MDNSIETKKEIQKALTGLLKMPAGKPNENLTNLVNSIRKYKVATNLGQLSKKMGKLTIAEAGNHSHVVVVEQGDGVESKSADL